MTARYQGQDFPEEQQQEEQKQLEEEHKQHPYGVHGTDPEVEVDHYADDVLEDNASVGSFSINSSATRYEWRYGRRYHSYQAGSYSWPNDEEEQDRLDLVHHVFYRISNDRLFLAPIDPAGMRILDIGTGTGVWPIHLGDVYPEAALIVGNDLSPIQPEWTPPNVKFTVDDVELDWIEHQPYDYVHCRYMAGSIKDWPRLARQIFRHLRPGGWVEFQEVRNMIYSEDDTVQPVNSITTMLDGLREACDIIGRTLEPALCLRQWAIEAGFGNVEEQVFKLPIGGWPKDLRLKECGILMAENFIEGVDAFTAAPFQDVLGWKREEVLVLNAGVRAAARDNTVHSIMDLHVITAQKPDSSIR